MRFKEGTSEQSADTLIIKYKPYVIMIVALNLLMIVCRNTDLLNMGLVDCIKCLTIASVIRVSFMGLKI